MHKDSARKSSAEEADPIESIAKSSSGGESDDWKLDDREMDDGTYSCGENSTYEFIKSVVGASDVSAAEEIQELWSGYGSIKRYRTNSETISSVVLKTVVPPAKPSHPRGWSTSLSNQRKLHSYLVESNFYQHYAGECGSGCRVPRCYQHAQFNGGRYLLLEDLDEQYPRRRSGLSVTEVEVCLAWLAKFHARFLGREAEGLWPVGTYWHLDTRPDEYREMAQSPVKQYAKTLDRLLNNCHYQTLVHGDAKVANFCFSSQLDACAAVDFQYVGRGCGIKDVVYLLGSCLSETQCQRHEVQLLECYFTLLESALEGRLKGDEISALAMEWRSMYDIAWTDFYRFLLGWMPDHSKVNNYTKSLAERAIKKVEL